MKGKKVVDWKKLIGHRLLMDWRDPELKKSCLCEVTIRSISPLGNIKIHSQDVPFLPINAWVRQSDLEKQIILEDLGVEKI